MSAQTGLIQTAVTVAFVAFCALGASAQSNSQPATAEAQQRETPTTSQPYVVLTGRQVVEIEQRLRPKGREDLVGAKGGLQTIMYVESEKDKEHEAEVHEAADDYHMALEGSAIYTLGGQLDEPKEIRTGEWRSKGVVGGKTFEVKKGDIIFVPRGVVHKRDTRGRTYSMMLIKVYAEARPAAAQAPAAPAPKRRAARVARRSGAREAKKGGR